eukprot:CAMPEP_0178396758 /NCGR_PEP_ID=MMETSP0689_2-20121128/13892_1 /TAXON_ID=160604 /ORGANISM="Amphidinium massartii, Strain CS-259" /LENGTH=87 /DNA_ID=CAMNT_0020017439 /DNA_START=426 /DNA_END=689 /DNA_ORIENTATION=-
MLATFMLSPVALMAPTEPADPGRAASCGFRRWLGAGATAGIKVGAVAAACPVPRGAKALSPCAGSSADCRASAIKSSRSRAALFQAR